VKTDIEFLERLQEDLMEAAGREGVAVTTLRGIPTHFLYHIAGSCWIIVRKLRSRKGDCAGSQRLVGVSFEFD